MPKLYKTDDNFEKIQEPELVKAEPKVYNKLTDTVSIRSRIDANYSTHGAVTGKLYVFSKAGSIVNVDKLDADEILNKKRGRACCGNNANAHLFELV